MDKSRWVVGKVLADQAKARGDRPFLTACDGGARATTTTLTYAEADRMANRMARTLAALGVGPGDRVAVMLPNGLEACTVWLGLARRGAVHVAVNTGLKGAFLEHVLRDAGVSLLVADARYAEVLGALDVSRLRVKRLVVCGGDASRASSPMAGVESSPLASLLSSDGAPLPDAPEVSYRDTATIMYTSGTTGPSKGVLMPHAHVYLLGLGAVENLGVTESDVYYVTLPLFHANAMFMQLYACLIAGAHAVVVPKFSASSWLDDIRRHGCTMTNMIGVMTDFVLQQPSRPDDADNPLRLVLAVPTPPEIAPAFRARFGTAMVEGYGMTEVNMPLYYPVDAPPRDGSCGKPYSRFFDVRIVDPETDEPLPPGATGEIVVRPREPFAFMAGYVGMPDKTLEAWRSFWFHTGDAGRMDDDGCFYFLDRIKDRIRRRGENVSSFEIEAVLVSHPQIAEAAAIAIPSELPGGEDEVKACLVPHHGEAPDPAEVLAYCTARMPRFAVPRYFEILPALPRTPTEKVQKAKLREAGVTARTWDADAAR